MTRSLTSQRSATEVLRWGQQLIEPPLSAAVRGLPSSLRHVIGYHFGWWEADGSRQGPVSMGKALRPALTLLCARAVSSPVDAAIPAALAVELVHNFSLLHDDVMDGDPVRRHRPTVWYVFGSAQAILAGDALLAMAYRVVADSGSPVAGTASAWLSEMTVGLCEGQSADVEFERRDTVDLADCLAMVERKTAVLLGGACALGGLFGGAEPGRVAALREFGRRLGMAFQLVDDLLGIWGDPTVTGKPARADLIARKKSVPVVVALNSGTAAGKALADIYRQAEPLDEEQVAEAAHLVDAAGGGDWTRHQASLEIAAATEALSSASPSAAAQAELLVLTQLVINRNH